jgi:hypothetical protein
MVLAPLLSSCSNGNNPDPHNLTLGLLTRLPIFKALPPESELMKWTPAFPVTGDNPKDSGEFDPGSHWTGRFYEDPAFPSPDGGWNGPVVTEYFRSQLPLQDVDAFFENRATAQGWGAATGPPSLLYWNRKLQNGERATMGLQHPTEPLPSESNPYADQYELFVSSW